MGVGYNTTVVTNGLVFNFDAKNIKSYPGTGTSVYDLITRTVVGETVASPTFNSNGSFSFNGSTQAIIFPENSLLNTQSQTVEVWCNPTNITHNGFLFEKGNVNTQYNLFILGGNQGIYWRHRLNGSLSDLVFIGTGIVIPNAWNHIVGTFVSGNRRTYVNGILRASDSATGTVATNTNGSSIGVYGGYNGVRDFWYNGSISNVKVYNRALSETEIQQNFNALRGRFGI